MSGWIYRDSKIPNFFVLAAIIVLMWWGTFYFDYKQDAANIEKIKEQNRILSENNNELLIENAQLKATNQRLKGEQDQIRTELADYVAQEVASELFPNKKARHLCRIGQILFKENLPDFIRDLPC